jgi:hypothetical protein
MMILVEQFNDTLTLLGLLFSTMKAQILQQNVETPSKEA